MPRPLALTTALATGLLAAACSSSAGGGSSATVVTVRSTGQACEVSQTRLTSGTTRFEVTNAGETVTEFYLYDSAGTAIVSEVENIGPGLTRDLTVSLDEGSYVTACKPGDDAEGIRGDLAVLAATDGDAPATDDPQLVKAAASYQRWVADEADQLLAGTKEFAAAVEAGDVEQAKALYPQVRTHWERIEPVAERFGDIDPVLDAREGDLGPDQEFTGWHRLERDLWQDGLAPDSAEQADRMVTVTSDLVNRIANLTLTADQLGNGAKELLDEVATGKITGEEERYSHTDLYDFAANVEGSRRAFDDLRPVVAARDAELASTLDQRFDAMQARLATYREGGAGSADGGYVDYTALTADQLAQLSADLEALSEPVSRITATVLG